jgi:putative transposase
MARPLRVEYNNAFYHVTSRGNERKPVFKNNRDRERFVSYLESATERYGTIVHVFCLMDNHYHLFLETPRGKLSQIMHHYIWYDPCKTLKDQKRRPGHSDLKNSSQEA